ncbi:BON domain-containing protein [Paraburkholderia mimosarum]|uniref:BON domain-containing protein n=1 Tax=Paraburkholderia mimosarum TaxID=312026 RepID=UPI0009DE98F4
MRTDRDIQHRIEQELLWDPSVEGRYIQVSVHQHVATLRGCVPSSAQKFAAQCVAQRIVKDGSVVMELVVRPPEPPVRYHRQSRWLEIVSASKAPIKP